MKRRDFLRVSGATAGAGLGMSLFPRGGWAAPFGTFPASVLDRALPVEFRAKNVLEVFLYGGLSCWETLYLVDTYGTPGDPTNPNEQFYTFGGTGPDSVSAAVTGCGNAGVPNGVDFALDANGKMVKIGPFAIPLRNRPDVLGRMRLVVQRHNLEPHEAAIPLALTGKPVGSPSLAGLGAHLQRYFVDRDPGTRKAPFSYVFSTGGIPGDNVSAAATTGLHPGVARPLLIKVDNAQRLYDLLARGTVGAASEKTQYDALLTAHVDGYRQRLRFGGSGNPLRSSRFSNLAQAAIAVSGSDAVAAVLDPALFAAQAGTVCGQTNPINVPAMSLNLARHLLTHPTEPARYACVVDTGLYEASGGGGYDTHTENSRDTARNFSNAMAELMSIINAPGENDPTKISLDDTLVIINTEFGRTPVAQSGNGRNHHPYGYATALIGGPIRAAQKGVVGAIGPDGRATTWVTPSETRIAALLSLGIWPFSPEAFFVSDVQGVSTEPDAVQSVTERVLGYTL